jgi:hypothetical protein
LRPAAQLPRDLAASLQTARDAGAGGVLLWPFQTDMDVLVGDLFTK